MRSGIKFPISLQGAGNLLLQSTLVQIIGQGLVIYGLSQISAQFTSLILLLQVLTAAILSMFLFNELLLFQQILGGIILIIGIYIAGLNERKSNHDKNEVIKIANCSGFYGDKLSAAKDMVDGGPIDVLTGDYLAELTMTILYNQKLKRGEDHGYVGTFLKQFKDVAEKCQQEGIKIVTNAGGLNPKGMASMIEDIVSELNLELKVAYIDGDDPAPELSKLNESERNKKY